MYARQAHASAAFVTGTLAGIPPVRTRDGRAFEAANRTITAQIRPWYQAFITA
ncbi:hypothetical protein [Dickeya lacustris]|uniref:Uncharacterized protein n=1 Tax=Dickeya lacustris TaxID=2259638 RepID=A0ABY8G8H9_9GAMM|nr:hypothetical protein [Dickeya lacustris]WFN56258.1 hypothetical protein O1Q98_02810 [Dickeya lacustris]